MKYYFWFAAAWVLMGCAILGVIDMFVDFNMISAAVLIWFLMLMYKSAGMSDLAVARCCIDKELKQRGLCGK